MVENGDVPYTEDNFLSRMYRNPKQRPQSLHRCNKMKLDHKDDDDDEYQKNEKEYIHEDEDDGRAMMR